MKRYVFILAALAIAATLAAPALADYEKTPPGSFLHYRAVTVKELSTQVNANNKLKARYAAHFGKSPEDVADYFSDELELKSLDKPVRVTSYYIGKNGRVYHKTKMLPAGSLVFANSDGKPVIAWSCGNPLRADLPKTVAKKPKGGAGAMTAVAGMQQEVMGMEDPTVTTEVKPAEIETIAASAVTVSPEFATEIIPEAAAASAVTVAPSIDALSVPSVAVLPPIVGGGTSLFSWLAPLAGLGGAVALSAPPAEPTTFLAPEEPIDEPIVDPEEPYIDPEDPGENPEVVPEPGSIMALAAGVGAIAVKMRFRRK